MRFILVVIDSFGIGALPDAGMYGDEGSNTALHVAQSVPGPKWPYLKKLGLGNCSLLLGNDLPGCEAEDELEASWGVMRELSPGKDTTTGHWELAGLVLERPFRVFPARYPSFPGELVEAFAAATGRGILGNTAASGTEIIERFGAEHIRSGSPICYTSSDSVFQIAAHESVIPVEELYEICGTARRLCDDYNVGRVIARPFTGRPGNFVRTGARKDFSIELPGPTVMDSLLKAGVHTIGIGKIGNIFNETGLAESRHDPGNAACIDRTLEILRHSGNDKEFIFVNLVDTDMIFGHRRDPEGYCAAVEAVDRGLLRMSELLSPEDILVVTADHGCDPTFRGTDHTREYVPLLALRPGRPGVSLGIRASFADTAASAGTFFGLPDGKFLPGRFRSFL